MIELDTIDLAILALLQEDARTPHAAIGKAVSLTGPSVYARVQRLERTGVIQRYTTVLDPTQIRQDLLAFVRVLTGSEGDQQRQQEFEQFIRDEDHILECHDVDGEDCYILKVRTATPTDLRDLLGALRAFPFVTRTVTSIALATIKERGLNAPVRAATAITRGE